MSDGKYFTTTKKGEIHDVQIELHSEKKEKKREAVKKVIAFMTVGKDVSSLFPDVLNCIQTDNLELKKLVYLYIMNYAKSQPDVAIMAVNTFVNDCKNDNALIRALAIRTMGCIRVNEITEYVLDPLRLCLKDKDPYVRKTAAVCVAKLYDIDPEQTESAGFVDELRELLTDANPMVVANAVAALTEISESATTESAKFEINAGTLNKLLTALNECTEWGQVFILDALALYTPRESKEAQSICERVTPRLSHANAAVVLSAVKVLMKYMEIIDDKDALALLTKKLAPPLITLLSAEAPEVQYVALRNISLVVQKRPEILANEMKVFFVKYNDPIYVKLEKLDVMIRLASEKNIAQVLAELKEYATEVDVDFVRKSVRAIGRCAIKIESAAQRCVDTLLELIQTKVNYVVQEAIVVIKDIFRKYPNRYEGIIATLCENLDTLDEPEAKGAMIWIIGEYAERIDNAGDLLESFLETFAEEGQHVQLQLLTAIVKLFLKNPVAGQDMVQRVLSLATQGSDNPDLRDRGYIYWRLLSTDPAAAKAVVLAEKPLIADETDVLEPTLLDELICNISTLASVYHKPPSSFVDGKTPGRKTLPSRAATQDDDDAYNEPHISKEAVTAGAAAVNAPANLAARAINSAPAEVDLLGGLDDSFSTPQTQYHQQPQAHPAQQHQQQNVLDLDDLMGGVSLGSSSGAPASRPSVGGLDDIFGGPAGGAGGVSYVPVKSLWLTAQKGKGLEVSGTFARRQGTVFMDMTFTNRAMAAMSGFAIQFNKNSFGLTPAAAINLPQLNPGQTRDISLQLATNGAVLKMDPINSLQVALKNNVDVLYFTAEVNMNVFFAEDGEMPAQSFLGAWAEIPDTNEVRTQLGAGGHLGADGLSGKLRQNNIFTVARRNLNGQDVLYLSLKYTNGLWVLGELSSAPGQEAVSLALKTRHPDVVPGIQKVIDGIIRS